MDGSILPGWFWLIYYSFLFIVLSVGVINIVRKRMYFLSILAVALAFLVPIISIANSLFLDIGTNELTHLIAELQQSKKWSMFAIVGYSYMVLYLAVFVIKYHLLKVKTLSK